jgi:hypothetical protein
MIKRLHSIVVLLGFTIAVATLWGGPVSAYAVRTHRIQAVIDTATPEVIAAVVDTATPEIIDTPVVPVDTATPEVLVSEPQNIPTSNVVPPTNTPRSGSGTGGSASTPIPTETPTHTMVPATITLTVTDVPLPSVTPIVVAPQRLPVTGFVDRSDVWQNQGLVALASVFGVIGLAFLLYGRR